jgi:hypothetical protein
VPHSNTLGPRARGLTESITNLGPSGCLGLLLTLYVWIPPLEHRTEFLIEGLHPRLQQQMRPAFGLLHLLLLQKRVLITWCTVDSTQRVLMCSPARERSL